MCEIITSTKTTKIRKERTVFKVLQSHFYTGSLFSPLTIKPYYLHKQVESEITFMPCVNSESIRIKTEKGLYSFKTKKFAEKYKTALKNTFPGLIYVIVKCKIPIGSQIIDCDDTEHRYYQNYCSGVIISNKLIPIEIVN